MEKSVRVRVSPWAPNRVIILLQADSCKGNPLVGAQSWMTVDPTWTRCRDERSLTVSGVKGYPFGTTEF